MLHVIHLVYTEGHVATAGDDLVRADLCEEAIRLARLVVDLVPDEAEAHGLLALLLLTDARRPARTDADGTPVSLEDQDRSRWDRDAIAEGTVVLDHALGLGRARSVPGAGGGRGPPRRGTVLGRHRLAPDRRALRRARTAGPVAGRHASTGRSPSRSPTDPTSGWRCSPTLDGDERLDRYQPLHATRAELLARAGDTDGAADRLPHGRSSSPQNAAERTRARGAGRARRRSAPRIGLIIPCRPVTIAGCRRSTASPSADASTR